MQISMRMMNTLVCLSVYLMLAKGLIDDPTLIQNFLHNYEKLANTVSHNCTLAQWNFESNMTDYNLQIMLAEKLKRARAFQEAAKNASQYNLNVMSDLDRRQFIKIMDIGAAAQRNETKQQRLNTIKSEMRSIYSKAKVCLTNNNCVPLEPDLIEIMSTSRDYNILVTAWKGWRDASGKKMKNLFTEYVNLSNEAIKLLGFADLGAYWRSYYDAPTFEDDIRALYDQLRPLYEHLHAYVRRKLKSIYRESKFPSTGHIPAHLLGNMWAQQWNSLIQEFTPFPDKIIFDVTDEMIQQNYTAMKIFQTADNFFQSLGLTPMPSEFWNKSIIEKPNDGRDLVCHASAWDFSNGNDFRIKQCTVINMKDFITAHHEMGHIEYYLQYSNQPNVFKEGANPGFHEAIGDTISLSVQTPEHMNTIGLMMSPVNDTESDINFLMNMALQKIAFLPFGYLIDQWRWRVFRGDITPDKYNEEWWSYRCRYQGIAPPVQRTSDDFDPGAKYHIPADTPYISYFVSYVIQFQFHKALCDTAGYKGPLHRCDIYNNKQAGKKLSDMLKLGSSKPWTDAMFQLTGQYKMDAKPLMDYFKPLMDYLMRENNNDYGWLPQCPPFKPVETNSFNNGVDMLHVSKLVNLVVFTFHIANLVKCLFFC